MARARVKIDKVWVVGHVVAQLKNEVTGETKTFETHNIVTSAGDIFYARRAAGETPVTPFDFQTAAGMECFSGSNAYTKNSNRSAYSANAVGSTKAIDATYPKTGDTDVGNTGAGSAVVTWKTSFTAAEVVGDLSGVAIPRSTSPGATENLLMISNFGAVVPKTATDTLTIWVNHSFSGI